MGAFHVYGAIACWALVQQPQTTGQGSVELRQLVRIDALPSDVIPLDAWEFERGRQPTAVCRGTYVQRVEMFTKLEWPISLPGNPSRRLKQVRGNDASLESLHVEPFNNVTVRARWVELDSQQFVFFCKQTGAEPATYDERRVLRSMPRSFHSVFYIHDAGQSSETVVIRDIETGYYPSRMEYAVASLRGRIVLVYAAQGGLYQRTATMKDGALIFAEPMQIQAGSGINDLQIVASTHQLHMIWTSANKLRATLHYSQLADPEDTWTTQIALSQSARAGTAHMAVKADDIVIAWSDERFELPSPIRSNSAKPMLCHSIDNGRVFRMPMLLADPQDPSEHVAILRLFSSPAGLIILWPKDQCSSPVCKWRAAYVDWGLKRMAIGDVILDSEVRAAECSRLQQTLSKRD